MRSSLLALSLWDWLDIIGLLMVLVGVFLGFTIRRKEYGHEYDAFDLMPVEFRKEQWEAKRKKREDFWEYVLIFGLALEFVALPRHISEASRLNKTTEELHSTNLVLASQLEPRANRLRQSAFKDFAKEKTGGEIEILYAPYNGEAAGFAVELFNELLQAGWKMSGLKPKPADLEPTIASPRPFVPESFASIAIVSHDADDAPRWRNVPLGTKTVGEDGTTDIQTSDLKSGQKNRYQLRLPATKALANALEKAGFHSERHINSSLATGKVLVVIGAKE